MCLSTNWLPLKDFKDLAKWRDGEMARRRDGEMARREERDGEIDFFTKREREKENKLRMENGE